MSSPEFQPLPVTDPRFASLVVQCPIPGKENLTGTVEEILDPTSPIINALPAEKAEAIRGTVQDLVRNTAELVDVDGLNPDRAINIAFGRAVVRDDEGNVLRRERIEPTEPIPSSEPEPEAESPQNFFKR